MNLVPAIKQIERQLSEMDAEHERQRAPYVDSLAKLREINDTCEYCFGKGKVLRSRACAEDDVDPDCPQDYIKCIHCNGTGKAHPTQRKK